MRRGIHRRPASLAAIERRRLFHDPARRLSMRRPGKLPSAIARTLVLARQVRPQRDHVAFGLQIEDRHRKVAANPCARRDRIRGIAGESVGGNTGGIAAAAVDEVPVEEARGRVNRVDVGHEAERRLRTAGGEHVADPQSAQRILAARLPDGPRRLREDVVRVGVAGMREAGIADGVPCLQAGCRRVDADRLRADADPRVAFAHDLFLHLHEVGGAFELGGDVQPLDDQRAVEAALVGRPPHEQANREWRGRGGCRGPETVHVPPAGLGVRGGRPR